MRALVVVSALGVLTVGTIVACPHGRDIWQALEMCDLRGGTLAAPIDAAENSLIIATAFGVFDESYWIGIHDMITEGTWQKIDGTPVTFTAWAPGRPNGGGGQNCAVIDNGLGGGGPVSPEQPRCGSAPQPAAA